MDSSGSVSRRVATILAVALAVTTALAAAASAHPPPEHEPPVQPVADNATGFATGQADRTRAFAGAMHGDTEGFVLARLQDTGDLAVALQSDGGGGGSLVAVQSGPLVPDPGDGAPPFVSIKEEATDPPVDRLGELPSDAEGWALHSLRVTLVYASTTHDHAGAAGVALAGTAQEEGSRTVDHTLAAAEGSADPVRDYGDHVACSLRGCPATSAAGSWTDDAPGTRIATRSAQDATTGTAAPTTAATSAGSPMDPLRLGTVPGLTGPVAWVVLAAAVAAVPVLARLYRRLTRDDLLDNDLRASIVDLLDREPGTSASELADHLDVAINTVLYHGRVLEEAGLVAVRRLGNETLYFRPDTHGRVLQHVVACRRQATKARILDLLAEVPEQSLSDLARKLDRAPSTIKHHVDPMLDRGLVEGRRDGTAKRLDLTDAARRALGRVR